MGRDYKLFSEVLGKLNDGKTITFTSKNVARGDSFLIFSAHKSCTCTFKRYGGLLYVLFEHDEPMLLENCPDSFLRSILKNL